MGKIVTVSIIGVGARGGEAYGRYISTLTDKYKITSICDINPIRLDKYGSVFGIDEENKFLSEEEFFKKKRSDLLLICTLDKLHIRMAQKALELGYDILLEKPVSDNADELEELLKKAQNTNSKVVVCHVLRYTVMVKKLKSLLDSGSIGKLISIDHIENVGFWHQAHSYVRGNWQDSEETTPMIMAKCCHDFDLIQYFVDDKCKTLSSMGDLSFFKKENDPEGSAEMCVDCQYIESCKYSAKKIYIDMWKDVGMPENTFPFNLITDAYPVTEAALREAISTGRYGKCVYKCDNNVVDHQTVIMTFESGITATLKMESFVKYGGRDIRFLGTEGELVLNEWEDRISLKRYFEPDKEWKVSALTDELGDMGDGAHGGGDQRMIDKLYDILTNGTDNDTALVRSIESHYMAIAAEESRLDSGKLIEMEKYRK